MKGVNGIQFNASREFIEFKKKLKNDRIKAGKEGNGDLSDKRLSKTFVNFMSLPNNFIQLVNVNIDLND